MWKLLKKLYSFDGEEHDGFEEEGNIKMDEDHNELQLRVIRELESRRVQAIDNIKRTYKNKFDRLLYFEAYRSF